MKVSDQTKQVENAFAVSNHTFVNQLAAGLQQKIAEKFPDMIVKSGGKSQDGRNIKLVVSGMKVTKDADELERVNTEVRQMIDDLKNPSDLLSLLE